jgi:hypothetical protein
MEAAGTPFGTGVFGSFFTPATSAPGASSFTVPSTIGPRTAAGGQLPAGTSAPRGGDGRDGRGGQLRLGFCFSGQGNDFVVWKRPVRLAGEGGGEMEQDNEEKSQLTTPVPVTMWSGGLGVPLAETRKLFSEAYTVFMDLQKYAAEFSKKPELLREAVKKSSKSYRLVINILITNLQQKLERLDTIQRTGPPAVANQQRKEELKSQLGLWKIAEIVWHLSEIVFISSRPQSIITESLVVWLQHFDVDIDGKTVSKEELNLLIRNIVSSKVPEKHESYWPVLYKLVLRGQILKALELLYAHSERRAPAQTKRRIAKSTKKNIWLKVEVLLKQTPVFGVNIDSMVEFETRWERWQADCRSIRAQAEARNERELLILFSLLSGEESAIQKRSENWQEFMVASLLYVEPKTRNIELANLVERAVEVCDQRTDASAFNEILVQVLKQEPYEAIQKSWDLLHWWFAAHLTDLLFHAGPVEDIQLDAGSDLREHFLLGFVQEELLASGRVESMWHLAVSYLSFCPSFGSSHMKHLLERIPLESEKLAYKVLTVCAQHKLMDQAKLIFVIMGMRKYQERRYGASIQWFVRAAHSGRLSQVANRLVDDFYLGKNINADEITVVVEQLDQDFVFSERLVFLSKVRDLRAFEEQENWRAFAKLTLEVITKKLAPRRYWIMLLDKVVPLLEATPLLFDFEQTELLMASLEDVTSAHYGKGYTRNLSEDKLAKIRLALARNRARVICV